MSDSKPPPSPDNRPTRPADDEAAARLLEVGLSDTGGAGRVPPPSPEDMAPHFPEYEVLEVLGQGGMGVVYKARQRKLDRLVALKVLPHALGADPAFAERFAREARTLARLQHPHIVGLHEFGEVADYYFLVMEYVDGVTLRQLMRGGELTSREALAIVPQICDALQYAHDAGVVHRDIKPENVLLDRAGRVKVADFGLAKLVQRGEADFTLTGTDQVMGTLHYMAPEQYKTPQDVDHRADIFSLGVVFFEMLTGELPVGRFANPSESPDLDDRIDDIVMRALERERELRYQKASDVKADVRTFVAVGAEPLHGSDGAPTVPADASPATLAQHWQRYRRRAKDGRRISRWVVWALWLIPIGAAAGLLVYGFVYNLADARSSPGYVGSIAGLWTAFGFAALAVLLAITGIVLTRRFEKELRGLPWAIVALVLSLIGMAGCLAAVTDEIRTYNFWRAYERERAHRPRFSSSLVRVEGVAVLSQQTAIREAIVSRWNEYLRLVSVRDLDLGDVEAAEFYDEADLAKVKALSTKEFEAKREANELGMGFVGRASSEKAPHKYQLSRIQVDEWERQATVTAINTRGLRRPMAPYYPTLSFFMKRSNAGWVFALDTVNMDAAK